MSSEIADAFAEAIDMKSGKEEEAPKPIQQQELNETVGDDDVDVKPVDGGQVVAVKKFEELNLPADILQGVYAKKFERPSKIQETALPLIFSGKNLIAQSQNGTGKTAAFALGILARVEREKHVPQALVICPTRELAKQIHDVAMELAHFTTISFGLLVPDSPLIKGKITKQVLIGTPGTVIECLQRTRSLAPREIKMFVLDEADQMMDQQGFADASLRIRKMLPASCQLLLFSATYEDKVRAFAEKAVPNANQLMLKTKDLPLDSIQQYYFRCQNEEEKYRVLSDIYGVLTLGQSVIFVNTRKCAADLRDRMAKEGHTVSVLYGGDMTAAQRDQVMSEFRSGATKVLITTNVMARGIDVLQVSLVINFELPVDKFDRADPATYIHRIGRTGRWTRKGVAISFVHDKKSEAVLMAISRHFGREIKLIQHDNIEQLTELMKV